MRTLQAAAQSSGAPWAWKLGSIADIRIFVHPTFFLLLAWVATSAMMRGETTWAIAVDVLLILCVFCIVVLHELGHALTAKRFGLVTHDITLLPIGGVARLERMPERPAHELLIAIAGPLVNVTLAVLLFAAIKALGIPLSPEAATTATGPFLPKLMWVNVSLAVFNLLPAFPMDGGRVLRALLAMRLGHLRATQIAANVGRGVAVLIGFFGLFGNPFLVVIAFFVWMGARGELWIEQFKSALEGVAVGRAMVRNVMVLDVNDTLRRAAELSRGAFQRDFPVAEGKRVVGVLTHDALVRGLVARGPNAYVAATMQRSFVTAKAEETLDQVMRRLESSHNGIILVLDHGALCGMLTPEQVGQMLALDGASRSAHPSSADQPPLTLQTR
jgi:Zn-dependent protease/CBS domain-containing protein